MKTMTITRPSVMNFWLRNLNKNKEMYVDDAGELNITLLGEEAAEHFGVMSDNGQTEIEQQLFDWAVEFEAQKNHI